MDSIGQNSKSCWFYTFNLLTQHLQALQEISINLFVVGDVQRKFCESSELEDFLNSDRHFQVLQKCCKKKEKTIEWKFARF